MGESGEFQNWNSLKIASQSGVMQITVLRKPLELVEADALIVLALEGRKEERFNAADLADSGEIAGKALELTLLHHVPGVNAKRVLLAGAGKPEKFDTAVLRKVVGCAVRHLKSKSVKKVALVLDAPHAKPEYATAAVEGAILGDFDPNRYQTSDDKKSLSTFSVLPEGNAPGMDQAVARGRIIAEAQNFTRALVNEP